ncbi:MAG: DUF72 domain-containing protein [Acidobacteriaceae bacterium]|nr:DUF72 domain-containing protein [Acidobacteriaceae bacterium]MBV9501646.1 DUF72 domain-containing protein [Acidobacteriaceae bacterium]
MIRIGPAGWNYKDWAGIVYPAVRPCGFSEPGYLANYFDTLEINTSFYGPPQPETARKWTQAISHNPHFKFTAKLWRGFTHERNAKFEDEKLFKAGMEPIAAAGRLDALLLQFPISFKNTPENLAYLRALTARFQEYALVIEIRHASWNQEQVIEVLSDLSIGLCNIDQPLLGRALKPSAHSTSRVGYIRLHGRNYKSWFSENSQAHERYDYLYSTEELEPWIDRIKTVSTQTEDTYVVSNNHYLGKAAVNAIEIASIFRGEPVNAPSSLVQRYPELKEFVKASESPETLFG